MRGIILGLCLIMGSSSAFAQRPATYNMTCQATQSLVKAQGAVVLSTSPTTYDRYVRGHDQCYPEQYVEPTFEHTRDNPACLVGYRCLDPSPKNF